MNGYIALISVLIVLAVVLVAAIGAGFMAINEADMGLQKDLGSKAYFLAHSCAEEALQQVHDAPSFQGTGDIVFDKGTCQYQVTGSTINASGTVSGFVRRMQLTFDQSGAEINIISWQEVVE